MRALTVQQPWAWAIVHGGKTVENRTQAWGYRGPLAIHAGKRFSDRSNDALADALGRAMRGGQWQELVYGAIIGVVQLVDVHWCYGDGDSTCCQPWGEHEYVEHGGRTRSQIAHLVLEDPRPVDPIPCTGRLGLWTPDADVLAQLAVG